VANARARGHEVFVLPTCLRVEVVWSGGPELADHLLAHLYEGQPLPSEGVMRTDSDAFLHLCRVAAGLDSPLVGETEVLAQFRQAVRRFVDSSSGADPLARVLQAVIGVSRVTRRSFGSVTEGSLAVEAARLVSSSKQVAILGGGGMAGVVARHLNGLDVMLFTRRAATAAGRPRRPWNAVPEALATYPAVVSTVPGGVAPFNDDAYLPVVQARREPLLFIDIGMPPVINEPPSDASLRYMGVDEVAASVEIVPAPEAEEIVEREALVAWGRLSAPRRAGSIISGLSDRVDRAVDEEVDRFANRIADSSEPEPLVRQLAETVARRVLHDPISYIGSRPLGGKDLDLVAEIFGLEDE
jgi:glutamyl-tRNA reductase